MDIEAQNSLGAYLRKEREEKNISLEQVAYATRINLKMLVALEEDNHNALPAQTFVRGYLQAYAKYVKLDGQDILLRYQHLLATTPVKQSSALKSHYVYVKERYQEKKQLFFIISLFTMCLISAGTYFVLKAKREHNKSKQQQAILLQPQTSPTPPATIEAAPIEAPSAATPIPIAQTGGDTAKKNAALEKKYNLSLLAKEDVWLRFQTDEDPVKDILLRADKSLVLNANKVIKIFSGNLNGMKATLNGTELNSLSGANKAMSAVLPETEVPNYPLPLFPQFVKKEKKDETTPAIAPEKPANSPN